MWSFVSIDLSRPYSPKGIYCPHEEFETEEKAAGQLQQFLISRTAQYSGTSLAAVAKKLAEKWRNREGGHAIVGPYLVTVYAYPKGEYYQHSALNYMYAKELYDNGRLDVLSLAPGSDELLQALRENPVLAMLRTNLYRSD